MSIIIKHPSGLRFEIGDDGSTAFGTVDNPRACLIDGEFQIRHRPLGYFKLRFPAHSFGMRVFKVFNGLGLKIVQPFCVFASKKSAKDDERISKN